jgi:hypothetical protein
LSCLFSPLFLTLPGPVIVNILFFDIFLDSTGLPLGTSSPHSRSFCSGKIAALLLAS